MLGKICGKFFVFLFSVLFSCLLISCSEKAVPAVNTDSEGAALKGYDPVAYFTEDKPVKGRKELEHIWNGAKWRFSNERHKDLFIKTPEKYMPQYGGYCAFAVSMGATADIDPESWKIMNGKLYLNLNKKFHALWLEDIPGNIKKGDENWPRILKGEKFK